MGILYHRSNRLHLNSCNLVLIGWGLYRLILFEPRRKEVSGDCRATLIDRLFTWFGVDILLDKLRCWNLRYALLYGFFYSSSLLYDRLLLCRYFLYKCLLGDIFYCFFGCGFFD